MLTLALVFVMFCLFPVTMLPFLIIMYIKDTTRAKNYAIMISFSLSIIAYYLQNSPGLDLTVYYSRMNFMRENTLSYAFNNINGFKIEPLSNIILFAISKTNKYQLFPFLSTLFSYSITLWIYADYANKFKTSIISKITTLSLIFALNTYLAYATGFRFSTGTTIILIGIYYEFINKNNKFSSFILYIFSCFFHSGLWFFPLLRIILVFYKQNKILKYIINVALCTWSLFDRLVIKLIAMIPNSTFNSYINDKYNISSDIYTVGNSNAVFVYYLKLGIVIMILMMCYSIASQKINNTLNSEYVNLMKLTSYFTFGSVLNKLVFGRYLFLLLVISEFLVINFYKQSKKETTLIYYYVALPYILLGLFGQMNLFSIQFTITKIKMLSINIFSFFVGILT